mmetsp:Transcript_7116/g.44087  ORF Transcript_7116/g.44087 Transcript_7116/m.44087 type:complete len:238 (+) Transcript_7116:1075-1788(+)
MSNLKIKGQELLLPFCNLHRVDLWVLVKFNQPRVKPVHGSNLVCSAVLYFTNTRRLKDTAPSLNISIHLHLLYVDGWIYHDPSSPAQFSILRYVNENWVTIDPQLINNHCSKFKNLPIHVSRPTTEATPVCKYHQWEILSIVKILDCCSSLICTVGEPNLASLLKDSFSRFRIGRVCRNPLFHQPGFHCNNTHWDPSQSGSSYYNTLTPFLQSFCKRTSVKKARQPSTIFPIVASKH